MAEQEREGDRRRDRSGEDPPPERSGDRTDDARPQRPGDGRGGRREDEDADAHRERLEGHPPAPSATPLTQQLGRAFLIVLAILFAVFALSNLQPVTFSWVFGQTEVVEQGGEYVSGGVRLIVLLIVAFVTGALIGAGLMWRRDRQRYLDRR